MNSCCICEDNGLVGVKVIIFEFGNLFNLSIANKIAIFVFPSPVGITTSVLFLVVVSKIFFCYSLGWKFLI